MRVPPGLTIVLSLASLIGLVVEALLLVSSGSGSFPLGVLLVLPASLLCLAAALVATRGRHARLAAVALLALGADVAVIAVQPAGASSPVPSALGALLAFFVAPALSAFATHAWPGFRAAFVASVAVPVLFILSLVVDGPILQGVGGIIDAIDAVVVHLWLVVLAVNLIVRSSASAPIASAAAIPGA